MSPLGAVLIDFGGTLDGNGTDWFDRFRALYHRAGIVVRPELLRMAFGHAEASCMQAGRVRHRTLEELVRFHVSEQARLLGLGEPSRIDGIAREFCDSVYAVLRENVSVLRRMSRRFAVGIVSNWYGNLREICDEIGLGPLLRALVDSEVVGVRKPDPRIFRLALDGIGVEPPMACFVGDSVDRDLRPAKGIGMRTAWLLGASGARAPEDGIADWTVRSLAELEGLLP
jgi:putative hydrolase of the HAD superfamily